MKEIQLTRGQIALVDDEDYEKVNKYRWHCIKPFKSRTMYAARRIKREGVKTSLLLHRFILSVVQGYEVDHIDGSGLNNQKNNLRVCTRGQNQRNLAIRKDNSSGYKGVSFNKREKKWKAYIMVNHKYLHIGTYPTAIKAALAYNEAAINHHGEFARLNEAT